MNTGGAPGPDRSSGASSCDTPIQIPELFRDLLLASVSVAQMDPRLANPAGLDPLEQLQISRAVDRRRREYTAGRLLARSLLRARGLPDAALLNGADRAPLWPAGVTGSITHCSTLCVVALAHASNISGVGIDVEHAEPLPDDVASRVVSHAERESIAKLPAPNRELAPRLIFSAKEASYKALYPRLRRFLEFSDLHVEIHHAGYFNVCFTGASEISTPPFSGRYRIDGGLIATAVTLEGPPGR